MKLAESTWREADALETDMVLLPVGSIEQHGPHAPLSTDLLLADVVTEVGADAFDDDVVIAPALPYGVSAEHRQFTGTIWLQPDTFRAVIRDVVSSLASHGWNRVVIVNGHGGNVDALREVAETMTRREEAYTVVFTWFQSVIDGLSEMGHGGHIETPVLRAYYPELVREDRVEEAVAGASDGWGDWVGPVNLAADSAEFTASGVVGDPGVGDAEQGRAFVETAGERLATVLSAVSERRLDRPPHK